MAFPLLGGTTTDLSLNFSQKFGDMFSPHLETALAAIGQGLRDEKGLEGYYDIAVADHIRFGPNAQVIWPGTPGKATALFLGARARLVF